MSRLPQIWLPDAGQKHSLPKVKRELKRRTVRQERRAAKIAPEDAPPKRTFCGVRVWW